MYYDAVNNITFDVSALSPGDLVFYYYSGHAEDDQPGHVGIYIGNNNMLDSQPGGGVRIRSVYSMSGFWGGGSL